MADICSICEGSGLRIVRRPDGVQVAEDCICRVEQRVVRMLERAQIPRRYEHCTLDSFETKFTGAHRSLEASRLRARGFVDGYPLETEGRGLLITGPIGIGKTHIATGILQALVSERGAKGLFCDYRDLLKKVQNTYNQQVAETELEILRPVFEAEVLVLDELGAAKPTDWVWDTVAHILNTRYNDRRTTIITTNYANISPLGGGGSETQRSAREETLGDRIGERMRSRLQEMCVLVEMHGEDFRQKVKRASFP
jgi:DNA replication protein DnaC